MIFSKIGDIYNEDISCAMRDFMALWNTNRFDDISARNREGRPRRDRCHLRGYRAARGIRDIKYEGAKSVSTSDIPVDRFKERKSRVNRAESMCTTRTW